jgi:glycosyltransferase involved in cell wall biosynthesis
MKNKLFFYARLKDKQLFYTQRFYCTDIQLLKSIGYDVKISTRILDFIFFWRYDVVFIYFYRWGIFVSFIAKILGKKVYFTGGLDFLDKDYAPPRAYFIQKLLFKICNSFSTNCIIVSKSDEMNIKKIYRGKLPLRTSLSFHTIQIEEYLDADLKIKENIFTTVVWMQMTGNVLRKGVDKALVVFKHLTEQEEFSQAKFYIIGTEGEGTEYLKSLVAEMNLQDSVIFTGRIDEEYKVELLKKSKCYFQLSTYEGFGIAALEALAAKNIVIHSGNGELKETIKDYGIKVDLKKEIRKQIPNIYEQIIYFDKDKLERAQEHIRENYANVKRQNDFERILKGNENIIKEFSFEKV